MQLAQQTYVSVALDADGLAAAATSTGASYVLTANDAGDSLAHLITIANLSATDHSLKTATITGTDANGNPLTETLAMPAASPASVTSTKHFKTVTSIVPSASTGADTFNLGWTAESLGATIFPRVDVGDAPFNLGVGCTVDSGTPTFSVQHTYDGSAWFTATAFSGKNANTDGGYTTPLQAMRLKFTAAGGVTITVLQSARM